MINLAVLFERVNKNLMCDGVLLGYRNFFGGSILTTYPLLLVFVKKRRIRVSLVIQKEYYNGLK